MDSRFSRALLLGAALFLYVPKLFVALTEHAGRWGADYYAFYWAAYYTFNLRRSPFGDQAFAAIPTDTGLPIREFVYPAPSLLFFYPLSWFSEWGGGLAIFLLSQTCILLLLFLLVRELAAPRTGDTTGLMCATAIVVYFLNFDGDRKHNRKYSAQSHYCAADCFVMVGAAAKQGSMAKRRSSAGSHDTEGLPGAFEWAGDPA